MYAAQLGGSALGFNPLSTVKKGVTAAAKGVAKGAKAAGKGIAKGAVTVGKLAVMPVQQFTYYVLHPLLALALRPITNKINTISTRRARKLSWDKRKTLTPNPAETAEAKKWTHDQLAHHKGIGGKIVAALAYAAAFGGGKPPKPFGSAAGDAAKETAAGGAAVATAAGVAAITGNPVGDAAIAAAIPIGLAIVTHQVTKLAAGGAPADPRSGPSPQDQAAAKKAEADLAKVQEQDAEKTGTADGMPWWGWGLIGLGALGAVGATLAAIRGRREASE